MRGLLAVATSWGSVLSVLTPLALVVAISPLSIIPAVLVLQTPRPRPTSLAFLGGWVFGLAALTAIFVAASGALEGMHNAPPTWASWLRVVLGSALILFGIYRWLTRHGTNDLGVVNGLICGAFFVAVSASTVAVPVLAYAEVGHRLDEPLARLKTWMEHNNAALMAAILLLIGLMVLHNGIRAL
jgi:hypothetical protein